MNPKSSQDPFDLDYEAEDEFAAAPTDAWREPPLAAADEETDPLATAPPPAAAPSPSPVEAVEPARPAVPNPVHEMLAGAEAAFGETLLPRITIHIFAAAPETAELADRAAEDRRMERTSVVTRMGGLAAAVDCYQNQATPSLVMVECLDSAPELLGLLDRLAQVCDPGTKVVLIGSANDIALYRELMRRGVSEYLVPPLSPLQMVRTVAGLYADPSAPFVGRQIAFCGAKGGAGTSTLAHNVAYSITERLQTGAVLVDLDLAFGTAGLDFNQDPIQGIVDALSQPDRLDPVLMDRMMARCTERLSLFAAPATLETDYEIGPEAFEEVTQKIRGAAPFVVLDLPHVWTAWKRKILLTSDDLVIVATPDLASLRNAKNMVDLVRRARPNDAPPRLVLNQVGVPGRPEIPVKDFGEALGLTPTLCLPFDPKLFGQAANNGQMVSEVGPKSRSAEGIDHLAQQIARRDPPAVQKTSLLSNLLKRK
ncbi:CpaE family protein [Phenylobacterium sp. LH3H17]|uniref:AAA family ATPase n=1 Tax=Phenylobacterium sp. LH3H17 TaxID=2903901 RepID=UPI0020C9FC2D|nr:CpaE family protein [Phenylobacterium sp. LH3H17]UTP39228.1 CpaE family protein [Phenylobacterium sp. LH3H17]